MINFHAKLKPALKNKAKSFFAPSAATTSASPDKCTNQEGCPMYQSSFFTGGVSMIMGFKRKAQSVVLPPILPISIHLIICIYVIILY
jgi:hypothetical protein